MTQLRLSTVGYKIVMALTGIALIGFLVGHMGAVCLVFLGPDAINGYAEGLRKIPALLWVARGGLLLAVFAHIFSSIKLTALNRSARSQSYRVSQPQKSTSSSRNMMVSGSVILAFVLYHLAHLTFRWTHAEAFAGLGDYDAYSMMVISFQSPWVTAFYVFAVALLMSHLSHGVVSFFRTLGLGSKAHLSKLELAGPAFAFLLTAGFASAPLSILLGFVR